MCDTTHHSEGGLMYLYVLTLEQVQRNKQLFTKFGTDRFDHKWRGDTRNGELLMEECDHNQPNKRMLLMPDGEKYYYIEGGGLWITEHRNLYLYKHVTNGNHFYDPFGQKPIFRYRISDAYRIFGQEFTFQGDYFYHQPGGDYYTYAQGQFSRHDLISNFAAGDLLYGTEAERRKVRPAIEQKLPTGAWVTADEIHAQCGLRSHDFTTFNPFHEHYDPYIDHYRSVILHFGKVPAGGGYHPRSAQAKTTKTGVYVSTEDAKIRRSCKALISFIMQVRNARTHFIVDGITDLNLFTDVELRHVKKYKLYNNANFKAYRGGKEVEWPFKAM
jgi:hypothetical protein